MAVPVGTLVASLAKEIEFTASADHASITSYELRVYSAVPGGAPVATQDLGKPTPDGDNKIVVDIGATLAALAVGDYVLVVAAIGDSGTAESVEAAYTKT